MKYKAFSRSNAEKYSNQKHNETSIVISIRSSFDKILPNIECNDTNNIKDILYLAFDDIDEYDTKHCTNGLMTKQQANDIVNFCNKWYNKIDKIIIHCDGGISRSVGVLGAISRWFEGIEDLTFSSKSKYPNMTCYLYVLDAFRQINNTQISSKNLYNFK